MSIDLRLPNIAGTDKEQLAQLRSYLYQLVPQLQWALNTLETSASSNGSNYVQQQPRNAVPTSTPTFDATTAFSDLKALIIKSADIVDAYYEEINSRLIGQYVAESDFGIFREDTEQKIKQSSTDIEQAFTNIQQILTTIDNLNVTLAETNAYIRSGLLYFDDNSIPIYGLEIGQENTIDGVKVFNKFARFTADRLSFYDQSDTEVAYISDYQLYINHVRIKSSLQEGGYKDFIDTNGGIVTKWVGGV